MRPHGELQPQNLETRMHSYLIATYNIISVGICATLYWKIKSEDERLSSVLKFKVMIFFSMENSRGINFSETDSFLNYIFRKQEQKEICTQLEQVLLQYV